MSFPPGELTAAIFGETVKGTNTFGAQVIPSALAEPMTAMSINYTTIQVSWTQPSVSYVEFRLIKNRYGYPVDQNDGNVLYDSELASQFVVTNTVLAQPITPPINTPIANTDTITLSSTSPAPLTKTGITTPAEVITVHDTTTNSTLMVNVDYTITPVSNAGYVIERLATSPLSHEGDTATVVYTYNILSNPPSFQTFNQFTFTGQAGQVQPGQQFQIYTNAAAPVPQPAQGPAGTITLQGTGSVITSATSTNPVPTLVSSQSYQVTKVSSVGNTYTCTYSPATPFPIPIGFIMVQQVPKNHSTVFLDTDVIPGTYHYYGIYVLTLSGPGNDLYEWQRAGVTACLAVQNFDSANWLWYHIPPHFRLVDPDRNLTQDFQGIDYLYQFMQIFAWGLDYLRTQYAMLKNMNNPLIIPINDLYNLAAELGFEFEPEVSMTTVRNGILNSTTVMRERGTLQGIRHHINILTGWDVDLQVGCNQLLEEDQSFFPDPVPPVYNPALSYYVGEQVCYPGYGIGAANYVFQCVLASPNQPTPHPNTPPFLQSPYWQVVGYNYLTQTSIGNPITNVLFNPETNNQNTWEARNLSYPLASPGINAIQEAQAVLNPLDPTTYTQPAAADHTANALRVYNASGTGDDGPDNIELQSVSRIVNAFQQGTNPAPNYSGFGFMGAVSLPNVSGLYPDNAQAIADGIPIPFTYPQDTWNPGTHYGTGQIVQWGGLTIHQFACFNRCAARHILSGCYR